ncbi:MAG: ATP-dependent Clp protease protease subunit [Ilumatobacter sp.]|jgi:ATP-dependent Clp protease protease subunit
MLHSPHTGGSHGSGSDLALEAAGLARTLRIEAERVLERHTGHDGEHVRVATERALVWAAVEAGIFGIADVGPEPVESFSHELKASRPLRPGIDA